MLLLKEFEASSSTLHAALLALFSRNVLNPARTVSHTYPRHSFLLLFITRVMSFKIKDDDNNRLSLPILACLLYKPSGLAPCTRSIMTLTLVALLFFFMFDFKVLTTFHQTLRD